jgi:Fe-S-cluster-containing hydrogenase component 2
MSKKQIKRIFVQKEKCNGCRICELRCSFEHEGVFSPSLSRIYVHKVEEDGITIPKICIICGKCIEACPEKAISKSEKTGAISIDVNKCTGKMDCVDACPYNVMSFNYSLNIAFTCDLCDGNPQCVEYCPEQALHYMTAKEFVAYKKSEESTVVKPEVIPE